MISNEKHKQLYIDILKAYEKLSTCTRVHVAALLVKDGRVLCAGYNGVPRGFVHCSCVFKKFNGKFFYKDKELTENDWREKHHEFSEIYEIHAETNCLMYALRQNIDISDADLVLSISPCEKCAKMIAASGVKNVYYLNEYDRSTEGIKFLQNLGVDCRRL